MKYLLPVMYEKVINKIFFGYHPRERFNVQSFWKYTDISPIQFKLMYIHLINSFYCRSDQQKHSFCARNVGNN